MSGLEELNSEPALVLKGERGNVSYNYFDMRDYFELVLCEEMIVLEKCNLSQVFDEENIRIQLREVFCSQITERIDTIVIEINKEFSKFGFKLEGEFLQDFLEYESKWLFNNRFTSKPVAKTFTEVELDPTSCSSEFIDSVKLDEELRKYREKCYTQKYLLSVIPTCIRINKIKDDLLHVVRTGLENQLGETICNKLKADLAKINCSFQGDLFHFLQSFISNEPDWEYFKAHCAAQSLMKQLDAEETIYKQDFYLINAMKLKELLRKKTHDIATKNGDLAIGVIIVQRHVPKKKYRHIQWLYHYANDYTKAINTSSKNKDLIQFVSTEFKFDQLLEDIYQNCQDRMKSAKGDFNNLALYRDITVGVNTTIGKANNDLQQVCYRLDFNISGYIHLSIVFWIWKYFEQMNWNKVNQPLLAIKDQKFVQKRFFVAMTSKDQEKIAEVEAKAFAEKIRTHWKTDLLNEAKQKITTLLLQIYKVEANRFKVQQELDEKYFNNEDEVDLEALYEYICEPEKFLETYYKQLVQKYLLEFKNGVKAEVQSIKEVMAKFRDRVRAVVEGFQTVFNEDLFEPYNICAPRKYESSKGKDVFHKNCPEELQKTNFKLFMNLVFGKKAIDLYELNPEAAVELNENLSIFLPSIMKDAPVMGTLDFAKSPISISNVMKFLKALIKEMNSLLEEIHNYEITDEDCHNIKSSLSYSICKQRCPCCDRICGEDDAHYYHRCIYGHQIRAIGGIKLDDGSASVSRCEDMGPNDEILYNGVKKTWLDFKEEMRNHPNNPWVFDDIDKTKSNWHMAKMFKSVWSQVGKRICEERWKKYDMKYVESANLECQKLFISIEKYYIMVIDSSKSMEGDKWKELLEALEGTLGQILKMNPKNKVAIVNFSSDAFVEYEGVTADKINVSDLAFQNENTNFRQALIEVIKIIKKYLMKGLKQPYSIIFLSDGDGNYPEGQISELKKLKSTLGPENFEFTGLKFQCTSDSIDRMCQALDGKDVFAADGSQLKAAFYEVVNRRKTIDLSRTISKFDEKN